MRTNGKCNNSHAPSTGLRGILLTVRPKIPKGPEYENKYLHYIDVLGEVLSTPRGTTTGKPLNNLEKTDPSEIERAYKIRKQQTRFY